MKIALCRRCHRPYHQMEGDPKDDVRICLKCLGKEPKERKAPKEKAR